MAIGLAVLATSCIGLKQYRNVTVVRDGAGGYRDEICTERAPNDAESDRCAVEKRSYTVGKDEGQGTENDYYFASVEFDDRGWFWDRKQMEGLLRFLYENQDEEFLIFAYAHGWQHNANACDNNVVCFQRLLERLDYTVRGFTRMHQQAGAAGGGEESDDDRCLSATEQPEGAAKGRLKPRKVIGVYIGWRGRASTSKPIRILSFFNRKRAANRVGIGGVTELLTRLNDFRRYKNPGRCSSQTQLVIAGHSFGGQVVYKALAHSLVERAARMESRERSGHEPADSMPVDYGYGIAHSFGDLVILVNPAFEGAAYEALQFAASNRCYPERQRPALMVVTSTADAATRVTFPIGRRVSSGRSRTRCSEQKEAVLRTVGHLDRYTSHVLRLKDSPTGAPVRAGDEGECGCPYLDPIDEVYQEMTQRDTTFLKSKLAIADLRSPDGDGDPALTYELGHSGGLASVDDFTWSSYGHRGPMGATGEEIVLERTGEYTANYPYLVIRTDENFIPSHSEVYGERFTDFVRRFYLRHLAGTPLNFPRECYENPDARCIETPITPCDRSWTGRPDLACEPGPDGAPR